MVRRQQAADRAVRPKLRSPGHPKFQRGRVGVRGRDRQGLLAEEAARIAIVTWIEWAYYRQRRLGRLTPIEFEALMNTSATLAA
jgi:hypothetical protein